MNMAASFIQRHKLKIKTRGNKNLSASILQTKCSVIVYNVVSVKTVAGLPGPVRASVPILTVEMIKFQGISLKRTDTV